MAPPYLHMVGAVDVADYVARNVRQGCGVVYHSPVYCILVTPEDGLNLLVYEAHDNGGQAWLVVPSTRAALRRHLVEAFHVPPEEAAQILRDLGRHVFQDPT